MVAIAFADISICREQVTALKIAIEQNILFLVFHKLRQVISFSDVYKLGIAFGFKGANFEFQVPFIDIFEHIKIKVIVNRFQIWRKRMQLIMIALAKRWQMAK
jgi:hypothetical protein